jgi:hypothetical protein
MYQIREPLTDRDQTAKRIKLLVERFHGDLDNVFIPLRNGGIRKMSDMTLQDFFNFVRRIPYRRDTTNPHPKEIISRPHYIVKHRNLGMDCKKKAILLGSFLRCQGIAFTIFFRRRSSAGTGKTSMQHTAITGFFNLNE